MATQSLYRRYRPRRFGEMKGQEHVVHALRTAVAEGREGQAYLFSGPRGTGKTTSARILAKVLNCEHPVDGEPCCECEPCLAVERGTSYDVHELDAASNNGVGDVRELIERAALGTPGRHKVYILDEVHMLTAAAQAALLKTLEEPPPHVVFVLATTDPQKVSDTIRSRTQHLQFHLLPADTLQDHVRWVAADAGIELDDEALAEVLTKGAGSPRDTLSALEVAASSGGHTVATVPIEEFAEAMIDHDAGRALTLIAGAVTQGRDPRTLAEEMIRALRDAFLSLMAPELVQVPSDRLEALTDRARRLGPPAIVRGIELLGEALVEMRVAPDPRVLLEVAAVQLTRDDTSSDAAALEARLSRLEARVAEGVGQGGGATTGAAAPAARPAGGADSTGRAKLGSRARRSSPAPQASGASSPAPAASEAHETSETSETPDGSGAPAAAAPSTPATPPATPSPADAGSSGVLTADDWVTHVRPTLRKLAKALYAPVEFVSSGPGEVTLAAPNEMHKGRCEQERGAVESALGERAGTTISVTLVVGGEDPPGGGAPQPSGAERPDTTSAPPAPPSGGGDRPPAGVEAGPEARAEPPMEADEDIDLDDLVDVPPESVKTPIDRLAEAFPGSELIEESA